MPFYDYRCEQGHTFEASQRMTDDPLEICEECGAPVERVLHAPTAPLMDGSMNANSQAARSKPKEAEKPPAGAEQKDEGGSWLDSVEPRKTPPTTFRRALRRK